MSQDDLYLFGFGFFFIALPLVSDVLVLLHIVHAKADRCPWSLGEG